MKILIIEDEYSLADAIAETLQKENYTIKIVTNGEDGEDEALTGIYDLILLDVMLPKKDGFEILRNLKNQKINTPIIMITAKSEMTDKLKGLENGVDDYITKPFSVREVVARVKAVLRRSGTGDNGGIKKVEFDKLTINLTNYELTVNGKSIDTPPKELELIYHLASNPNRVYTRDQLLDEVWGFDYYGDSRTVDVHVKRLREKLENVSESWSLKTVWGVGYKFEVK